MEQIRACVDCSDQRMDFSEISEYLESLSDIYKKKRQTKALKKNMKSKNSPLKSPQILKPRKKKKRKQTPKPCFSHFCFLFKHSSSESLISKAGTICPGINKNVYSKLWLAMGKNLCLTFFLFFFFFFKLDLFAVF